VTRLSRARQGPQTGRCPIKAGSQTIDGFQYGDTVVRKRGSVDGYDLVGTSTNMTADVK
jgi:hypothetical protein